MSEPDPFTIARGDDGAPVLHGDWPHHLHVSRPFLAAAIGGALVGTRIDPDGLVLKFDFSNGKAVYFREVDHDEDDVLAFQRTVYSR